MQLDCEKLITDNQVPKPGKQQLELSAEVIFGVPSQGCRGTGICKLTTLAEQSKKPSMMTRCKKGLAIISITAEDRIKFNFEKASMCKATIKKHFGYHYFFLEETFEVPAAIRELLELKQARIKPGAYPIVDAGPSFTVLF